MDEGEISGAFEESSDKPRVYIYFIIDDFFRFLFFIFVMKLLLPFLGQFFFCVFYQIHPINICRKVR